MTSRPLTEAERNLAASIFGLAINYSQVRIFRRSWWPLQTRNLVMAPNGNIYFHSRSDLWEEDFGAAHVCRQGLFIHEMTHVCSIRRASGSHSPATPFAATAMR